MRRCQTPDFKLHVAEHEKEWSKAIGVLEACAQRTPRAKAGEENMDCLTSHSIRFSFIEALHAAGYDHLCECYLQSKHRRYSHKSDAPHTNPPLRTRKHTHATCRPQLEIKHC